MLLMSLDYIVTTTTITIKNETQSLSYSTMNTESTAEEDPTINSTSEAEAEPVAKTIDDADILSESKNNEETTNSQTTATTALSSSSSLTTTTTTTMSEWLLQASNEEYDILTSWQLGYRFTGDNFGSKWWIHLQQLGFKHVGRLYELPPTYPKAAAGATTTKPSYDATGIYEQLDSLAVPQVTSTFDTIPIERGVFPPQQGTNNNNEEEMEWWRNIRDELIFRRYHKEIEQMCRGSGGSSTASNHKSTLGRKQQPKRRTGIAATTTRPQRKRKSSSTSTNTGAELYFQKKRTTKKGKNTNGTTNGRLSSKRFGTNQQQQDDDDPIEHPSIQEYTESVQTYTQHEQDMIFTIEEEYSTYFEEWRFVSSTNHSLLFHGAGSKKPLLNKFADEELDKDGDVIKLDGFHKDITIDQILQLLIDHWLNGKEPSNIDLFHVHNLSNNNHDAQILPFYPVRGDIYTIQKAATIAKSISKIVSTTLRPIYIVIHNIDGVGLRNYTAQESLAALVSQSTTDGGLNAIRLVASIDHVNGPALLLDTITRHRFQWVWKEIQTQRPYLEEVIQSQTVGVEKRRSYNKRGTKAINKMSTSEIETNNVDTLQQQRDSMFSVLKSLASRHTQALQQLAWLHLESKKEWITYVDLLNQCRLKCVVTQDVQLRNYLGELMDHHIVIRNDDKNNNNDKATGSRKGGKQKSSSTSTSSSSESTSYRIPYPDDALELILDYQVV